MAGDGTGGAPDGAPPPDDIARLDAVSAAIRDADADDEISRIGVFDPLPGAPLDGVEPGEWTADEYGLPPGCPVIPLGTEDGTFFFLDTIGQMRALKERDMSQSGLNALFMGRHLWLYWAFPKKDKKGNPTSWRPEKLREVLMQACARKGAWSAADRVRGRGVWRGRDGRLIIHCGDRLISERGEEPLGELENMVYPTRPPTARPWPNTMAGKPGPARELLPLLKSWNWVRPQLDPVLLTGWIGVAFLGGALKWRPEVFIIGDKGTGKSSLQADLKGIFGAALVQAADTTAAGLYQQLKFDSLPVAVDEFEAKADTRKAKAVIELGRISASGGPMFRGGDNHKGTQFYGRSAFLFSAINTPPLDPQDLSRLALLRLRRLEAGVKKADISPDRLATWGRQILRRLMDNWHRWEATYEAWRDFLAECGHDGRGQDTFGTLMAMADMVIGDDAMALDIEIGPNAETFEAWRPLLAAETLTEYDDAAENWQLCLNHMLTQRIEAWRGGTRHTVGEVLTEFFEADVGDPDALKFVPARRLLEQTGLTILKPGGKGLAFELFVPNQNALVHELMKNTKWQGELSAGSWSHALRGAPPDRWRDCSARINGVKFRGTAFALAAIIAPAEPEESGQ